MSNARWSGARRIAGFPCGRRTKWLVVAIWVIVVAVAGPLGGKLNGAEGRRIDQGP